MKKAIALCLVLLAVLAVPTAGWAASPWTEGQTYGDKVKGKLDFGVKNLLGGWTELITQPLNAQKNGKNILEATFNGLANGIIYTAGGALHLVTFPISNLDVPLPNNGVSF